MEKNVQSVIKMHLSTQILHLGIIYNSPEKHILSMLFWLFYNSGLFLYTFLLAWAIKRKKPVKNRYTRAMVPSFLFLLFADIFMVLSALFHEKLIFSLYKKGTLKRQLNDLKC